MFIQLSRHWWWLALRGIAAILFGILALAWRGDTLGSFMLLFGNFALVDGLLAIFAALTHVAANKRWWVILHGLVSIDIALFAFFWTESAATILPYIVAAWALITGMMEVAGARRLDGWVANEELLYQSGIASISFAVLLIIVSKTSLLSVTQLIGPAGIIFGLLTLVLSLNIRNMGKLARLMRQ
ncbi:MAG TPA: DUF308 domain-containing protein [Anaerolineales bacterium]|nr:DUF308 domain-containing protein [Anaerolineales bacterium]